MLSSVCPNCSAPIRFKHAASVCTRCESCSSSVVRHGDEIEAIGKVSSFSRDLSPLRVGATGRVGGRAFEVAGVLRKARDRVRWNEWSLVFDDGGQGWLGEGNGTWQLYDAAPVPVPLSPHLLRAGLSVEVGGRPWEVTESAEAQVIGVEGELPFAVSAEGPVSYADMRSADGRSVGTVDFAEGEVLLWVGRIVGLPVLELKGLRPITGWSDPLLTDMAGPELQLVRTLRCPNCGGGLNLRAPGQSQSVACEYCGSELGIEEHGDASEAQLIRAASEKAWKPALELGARGELEGVEYEIIGAMQRAVRFEGVEYPWVEYFLYNPYRGFLWLAESEGHWNIIRQVSDVPAGVSRDRTPYSLPYRGHAFRHFQGGRAHVRRVLGEFTWEVHKGDQAITDDWVAPPLMLSRERIPSEVTWTAGSYVEPELIAAAFGPTPPRRGIAPNQPNPYGTKKATAQAIGSAALFTALAFLLFVLPSLLSANEILVSATVMTDPLESTQVYLTDAFVVPEEGRSNLKVKLDSSISRDEGQVHVALLNTDDATAYLVAGSSGSRNENEAWLRGVTPGNYVGRIEYARASTMGTQPGAIQLVVVRDPPYRTPALPVFLYGLAGLIVLLVARNSFEARRWANSDHG
ncbi:MAG: DUF4178 domain-containing protein [Alphaproteobacteria bacterium]|nr:DUF4178 domain-containing protein [Alphaproteobacteria bacterium]